MGVIPVRPGSLAHLEFTALVIGNFEVVGKRSGNVLRPLPRHDLVVVELPERLVDLGDVVLLLLAIRLRHLAPGGGSGAAIYRLKNRHPLFLVQVLVGHHLNEHVVRKAVGTGVGAVEMEVGRA